MRNLVNVKELYMEWLLELFSIEESEDKRFFREHSRGDSETQHEIGAFTEDGRCRRQTMVTKEVKMAAEKTLQEERDKELIKAYLFKRLGLMAHESGVLDRLKQNSNQIENKMAKEIEEEGLYMSGNGSDLGQEGRRGKNSKGRNFSMSPDMDRQAPPKTQQNFNTPLKDLQRVQAYYAGTRFEVGKIP